MIKTGFMALCLLGAALAHPLAKKGCPAVNLDFSTMADGTNPMSIGFQDVWCGKNTAIKSGHLELSMTQECGPAILVPQMIQSGRVDVTIQTAAGSGVVTALTVFAPKNAPGGRDELDWEWVGKDLTNGQSMYFVKGQRVPGAEGAVYVNTASDTATTFHTYSIEYTPEQIIWYLDNKVVRTVRSNQGVPYPTQALQLNLGVWDGSQTNGWAGTVPWGNGVKAYTAKVSKLSVTPYTC
ncbi:hypothetical protein BZG36_03617 [Bifiguratus adelaidae]|uniref:GH16 domain-containing protein n=1 Tax=Bifiguratus adelaidae TaxID=1938954 RepID=A0A261Y029_9FUNG|nr:hypothetical protein BZG36_03617 [Bifiguratus adelaidae]